MDPGAKCIKVGISSFVDADVITEFKAEKSLKGIKKLQESLDFGCLESAFNNTKAFLKSAIAYKKLSCLDVYRKILSKDETNLNALQGLNNLASGKTEKQFMNKNARKNLEKGNKKEVAISTACLEIGFALQYLNEAVQTEHVLQPTVLSSDELKFKTIDDITAHCTTTFKKGVTRTPDDGFLDTCIEAVLYLREGLHRLVLLHENDQTKEAYQTQGDAKTQDVQAQDVQVQEDVQAREDNQGSKENIQTQEDAQIQEHVKAQANAEEFAEDPKDAQSLEDAEEVQIQEHVQAHKSAGEFVQDHKDTLEDTEEVCQIQKAAQAQEDAQLIWKFFLAKAYNRLVEQIWFSSVKKEDLLSKWSFEAIKLFCEVINGNKSVLRAKSYVYLGQMICKRKTRLGERVPENCNQYTDLKEIWKTPVAAFEKARSISKLDDTVLARYGKFLLDERDNIDAAIDILTEAIKQNESYWFAYFCRMIAYKKKYYKQFVEANRTRDFRGLDCSLLEQAKQDGKFCLKVKPSAKNALEYSRILHWLADLPKEYKGREPREVDEKGMRKAIDVLDKATVMESGIAPAYKERANCHYLIGELEEALLYMEAAVYSNYVPGGFGFGLPIVFRQFCTYAIEYVEKKMDLKDEKNASFAVRRLKRGLRSINMHNRKLLEDKDARLIDRDDQDTKGSFKEPGKDTEQTANIETAKQFKQPIYSTKKINKHLPKEEGAAVIIEEAADEEIEILKAELKVMHEDECKLLLEKDTDMSDKDFIDKLLAKYIPNRLATVLDELAESSKSVKPKLHSMICNNKIKEAIAHKMVLNALNTVKIRIDAFVEKQKFSQNPSTITLNLDIDEDTETPGSLTPSFSETNAPCNQAEKQYDFMIIHADEDKDWVVCNLLIQLEYSQIGFKGCLPERDFEPVKKVLDKAGINKRLDNEGIIKRLDNIKEGINKSNKILLAVSPDTPTSFYEDLNKVEVLGCLKLFNGEQKDTYVLNNGSERIPDPLQCFDVIDCGGLPLNLNEVREVLADKPLSKYRPKPIVSIQSTKLAKTGQKEIKIGIPENIMTAKCEVNKAQSVGALQLLRFGIQTAPVYCSLRNLEQAEDTLAFGCPQSDMYICNESCVMCYDTARKLSKWVGYHLTPDCIKGEAERKKISFHEDERIPEELRAKLADYNSTTDYGRGHQRPVADTKYSVRSSDGSLDLQVMFKRPQNYDKVMEEKTMIPSMKAAMYDTFTLTNVLPERKNNTMWSAVEVYVREKVLKDFGDVRIFCGPMFRVTDCSQSTTYRNIGSSNVAVPTNMFKIVIATKEPNKAVTSATFVVKNEEGYGAKEVKKGDEKGFSDLVKEMTEKRMEQINMKTIEAETGIQFDEMLRGSGVKFTEDLLELCPFISAARYKQYTEEHIHKTKDKKQKQKEQKIDDTTANTKK